MGCAKRAFIISLGSHKGLTLLALHKRFVLARNARLNGTTSRVLIRRSSLAKSLPTESACRKLPKGVVVKFTIQPIGLALKRTTLSRLTSLISQDTA